jgi:protein translocase SecG subunit
VLRKIGMFIEIILWLLFIGSAILLAVVILLQEAKGGGLAEAFGGMGAQTFGVKATGINKFTAYVAVVFLLSAVLITCMRKSSMVYDEPGGSPAAPGEGVTTPVEGGPGPAGGSGDASGDGE